MKTEARKTFRHGFVLTEQELRRTVDSATQQMQRIVPSRAPDVHFEVKLKNGTVAHSWSLEDLLSFENFASKQIVRLDIEMEQQNESSKYAIMLRFTNLNVEDDEVCSVKYVVMGEDRDWVLVTSSELEERVGRVKSFALNRMFGRRRHEWISPLFAGLFLVLSFTGMIRALDHRSHLAEAIEARWKAGILHDPIEVMILMQRDSESREAALSPGNFVRWSIVYPVGLAFVLSACALGLIYLYPAYVFCWGDYVKTYERRVSIRKFLLVGIVVSLAISVIAGVIVNRMGWGK